MTDTLKLPVGIENFEEIRHDGFYYADKTGLIEQLLNQWGEGESFYQTAQVWQDVEYEHASLFF